MVVGVGVLVNPVAGFGGMLAMHGTDGLAASRFDEAVRANHAGRRMIRALERFLSCDVDAQLVAAPGLLGAAQLSAAGIPYRCLESSVLSTRTDRHDTIAAAQRLVAEGVDVLVFAGGDGTATDIVEAVGMEVPVIGIPSGVKMHSEVFSRSPESAGRLLADFALRHTSSELAEVLDVGDDDVSGVVGMLLAPRSHEALQGAKISAAPASSAAASRAIAHGIIADAGDDVTWVIGPGSTAGAVAQAIGLAPSLRGVDVRHASGSIEHDVSEDRLYRIVDEATHPRLVLGVVGGQGFLLGRGNQQLSPRVIERIGVERIDIVATEEKVGGLFPPVLLVDVDGPSHLVGYHKVHTGARKSTVMRVVDAAEPLDRARAGTAK